MRGPTAPCQRQVYGTSIIFTCNSPSPQTMKFFACMRKCPKPRSCSFRAMPPTMAQTGKVTPSSFTRARSQSENGSTGPRHCVTKTEDFRKGPLRDSANQSGFATGKFAKSMAKRARNSREARLRAAPLNQKRVPGMRYSLKKRKASAFPAWTVGERQIRVSRSSFMGGSEARVLT